MNLDGALAMGRSASEALSSESLPVLASGEAAKGDAFAFANLAVGLGLPLMDAEVEAEANAEANDTPDVPADGSMVAVAQVVRDLVDVVPETDGAAAMALPSQRHEDFVDRRQAIGSLLVRSSVPLVSDLPPAAQKIDLAPVGGVMEQFVPPLRAAPQNNSPIAAKTGPVRVSPSLESALTMAGFVALPPAGEIAAASTVAAPASRDVPANLTEVLGERMQWLHAHGVDRAVVNLKPHMAGHVQVELSHEAGALAIRLTATQRDVVQQLQSITEELRHELGTRQFHGVSVQVAYAREQSSQGHGSAEQERRHEQNDAREPSRALDTPESDERSFAMNSGGGSTARE